VLGGPAVARAGGHREPARVPRVGRGPTSAPRSDSATTPARRPCGSPRPRAMR
jgi:hypothetical protein